MKNVKRIILPLMVGALMVFAFTACHSHEPEWKIDTEMHRKECSCGEISEEGEHSFEENVCTVCGAERKTDDNMTDIIEITNDYGDWVQRLYLDEEGAFSGEDTAEYTYDKDGNKLSEKIYSNESLETSAEYAYGSDGLTYKKYETEYYPDSEYVYEYNEYGDSLGYVGYDEDGNITESVRSEYITDEKGELIGEKVYENDVLTQEMKYAAGNDGQEDYLYITENVLYGEDGSKTVETYDEAGELIREAFYGADGKKAYEYDVEYLYDDEGNLTATEKREKGVLKQKLIYEYDEEGYVKLEKTYEGDRLVKEVEYTATDFYMYESKITTYNEDGTATVEVFDENGNLTEIEE